MIVVRFPLFTWYVGHLIPFAKVGRSLVVEQGVLHLAVGATHRDQLTLLLLMLSFVLRSPRRTNIVDVFPFLWFVVYDHRGPIAQIGLIDKHCPTVLLLQYLADDAKIRGRFPASFQLTTAGHSVALAANLHVVGDCLERGEGENNRYELVVKLVQHILVKSDNKK